ncbi:MAG: hypothetical protein ACLGXA_07570 [Acidobacteriota bacterium]
MALLVVYPWAQFFSGLLIGCWIGAAIAAAGILLLVGRRVRQLEGVNLLLRNKLRAHIRSPRMGSGGLASMLVMPHPGTARNGGSSGERVARVH